MAPRKVSKGKKPKETMRQRQMRLRKEQQDRKSRLAKRTSSEATNQRIEKVRVKVEPQKNLPASKATKALPPGRRGGAVSTNNRPRRRNVNTNPPSNTTRTGSQSPASVRREQAAVRRAKAEIGRNRMGPLSTIAGMAAEALLNPVAGTIGYEGGKLIRRALGGGKPTLDKDGKPIKKTTPKDKPLTENQRLARSNRTADRSDSNPPKKTPPKKTPPKKTPPKKTPPKKTTPTPPTYTPPKRPTAAGNNDAQDLRRGRTPDTTPSKPSKPEKKKYGVKDGNNAKGRTKRLMSALNNLKVRKYKK